MTQLVAITASMLSDVFGGRPFAGCWSASPTSPFVFGRKYLKGVPLPLLWGPFYLPAKGQSHFRRYLLQEWRWRDLPICGVGGWVRSDTFFPAVVLLTEPLSLMRSAI